MNDNEKYIEEFVKDISFDAPDDKHRDVLKKQLLIAFPKHRLQSTVHTVKIWRTIMKNPITKLAAVAVIIIAAFVGIYQFGWSYEAVTLGQAIENMKKAPWMHAMIEETERNAATGLLDQYQYVCESWTSINPYRHIKISSDGTIYFHGESSGRLVNAQYDPKIDTITTRFPKATDDVHKNMPDDYAQLFLMQIEELEKQGAKVEYTKDIYEKHPVRIINYEHTSESFHFEGTLVVSVETHLPMKFFLKTSGRDRMESTISAVIDYPDAGPTDIYQAGAPNEARVKIIDDEPQGAFKQALRMYQTARENLLDRYALVAICVESHDFVRNLIVIHKDGHMKRVQNYNISKRSDLPELSDSLKLVENWSKGLEINHYNIKIDDGKYSYGAYPGANGKWSVTKERSGSTIVVNLNAVDNLEKDLADFGWPRIDLGTDIGSFSYKLVQNDLSESNNLLCFERHDEGYYGDGKVYSVASKSLYYVDPQRSYLCVRREFFRHDKLLGHGPVKIDELNFDPGSVPSEPSSIFEVVEFGQTPTGQWYPKKIQKFSKTWHVGPGSKSELLDTSQSILVYVDTNPEFAEGIFDPENLPKGVE